MCERVYILVDDPEIVRIIAILLEKRAIRCSRPNGMEALEQAVNPALRLIVIDVMMPRLDGLSAVMKIREKRNLPIIVPAPRARTGQGASPSMGADDHIAKSLPSPGAGGLGAQPAPQYIPTRTNAQRRRDRQRPTVLPPEERCCWWTGSRVKLTATELENRGSACATWRGLPRRGDLPTGMERGGSSCHREHRRGTYGASAKN
ncbi:MAG: response regulator [Flavonifractor plautii]